MGAGGGAVRGDYDTLAAGQAIVFDHELRAKAVERGLNVVLGCTWAQLFCASGLDARGFHDVLGKGLGTLDLGCVLARSEDSDAGRAQGIGHAGDEGNLRTDDNEVRGDALGELHHAISVIYLGVVRVDGSEGGHGRAARRGVDFGALRVGGQALDKGVFTAARTNYENAHAHHHNQRVAWHTWLLYLQRSLMVNYPLALSTAMRPAWLSSPSSRCVTATPWSCPSRK